MLYREWFGGAPIGIVLGWGRHATKAGRDIVFSGHYLKVTGEQLQLMHKVCIAKEKDPADGGGKKLKRKCDPVQNHHFFVVVFD